MIIENPDAFKSWLTSILEPLCDADPAALAKYVYALVKKDKPVEELREVMVDQLDVFLQQETKPFVEMLFKSLEGQEYLKPGQERKQPSPPPADAPEPAKEPEIDSQPPVAPRSPPNRAGASPRARSPTAGAVAGSRVVLSRGAKLAAPAPPPPPPRHPHTEHTLVKVLPLTELLEEPVDQPPRRRDRRGDSTRDKDDRRRRRSRSWERRARARRHARENDHTTDVRRRISSRSPSPRRYRNRSPPQERQPSRSRSRSPTVRERDHERERDRLRVPRELERDRMSRDREHRDRVSRSRDRERSRDRSRERSGSAPGERPEHNDAYKRRCRDFDEKGYCMRGDLCQWDHGADPVVLEDPAHVLALPPAVPEYNPLTPDIWSAGGFGPYPPCPPHHTHPHPPRELVHIPRPFAPRLRPEGPRAPVRAPPPHQPHPHHNHGPHGQHKKNFDYNRFGSARPPLPANAANCSLEVKKVPRGLNEITHLNNHFCKFGKIVNIQVSYDGDPEAALITFSNPTEANVAYKSTEAVLNNRFIKVFWHNPENKQENTAPTGIQANKPTDNRQNSHPMSHNKVLINRDNIKATADIKQQQQQDKLEKEKELSNGANGQETRKEPLKPAAAKSKLGMETHKRAQALLEKQLQQQTLLIKRLESGSLAGPERAALLDAIGSAQEGIEKLRKELVAYTSGTLKQMQQAKKPKTKEEAQKEILDAELDLFTKQQEGQDVTELTKKIVELRRQMSLQFPTHPIMRRPHASSLSRGGRFTSSSRFTRIGAASKVFSVNQSVDHRPKALLISGFEADELDSLVAHFSQYGEVMNKQVELSVPQLVLQYKSRAHAEHAAANGKHYNDRTLTITWVANNNNNTPNNLPPEPRPAPARNGDAHSDRSEETPTAEIDSSLLRFDEEEEDDADEDRSWRR